jgi:hypothetical protein
VGCIPTQIHVVDAEVFGDAVVDLEGGFPVLHAQFVEGLWDELAVGFGCRDQADRVAVIGRAMVMDYGVMKALAVNDYYADVGT